MINRLRKSKFLSLIQQIFIGRFLHSSNSAQLKSYEMSPPSVIWSLKIFLVNDWRCGSKEFTQVSVTQTSSFSKCLDISSHWHGKLYFLSQRISLSWNLDWHLHTSNIRGRCDVISGHKKHLKHLRLIMTF